ncbi:hypothetical protein LguiB_027157 [Lonicera macranthoides]
MAKQKGGSGAAYLLRRFRDIRQRLNSSSFSTHHVITTFLKGENKVTLSEEESKKGTVKVFANKDDFEKIELTKSVYKNLCSNLNKVLKEGDKSNSEMFERMSNLIVLCSASGVSVEANEALEQQKKDGWMKISKDY